MVTSDAALTVSSKGLQGSRVTSPGLLPGASASGQERWKRCIGFVHGAALYIQI